jgi:hypothetical protein
MILPRKLINVFFALLFSFFLSISLLGLQPAESMSGDYSKFLLLNFIFLVGVIFFSTLSFSLMNSFAKENVSSFKKMSFQHVNIDSYAALILFFTLTGFGLLLYDRIMLRGIDYSVGIRNARYMWIETTGGNISGFLGNIFNSFGYLALFRVIHVWSRCSFRNKLYYGFSILFSVVGLAVLNGGRANILFCIFILISIWILSSKNIIFFNFKIGFLFRYFVFLLVLMFPVFVVTESSAQIGNYSPIEHYVSEIISLYGRVDDVLPNFGFANDIVYKINYMIIYLFHGQWTFQVATDLSSQLPFYTFYPIKAFFSQFGLIDSVPITGYFSDTGAFISLPGALFYDYGLFGVAFGSIILGFFLGHVIFLYNVRMGAIAYLYSVLIVLIIVMSPFCVPYGFSIFFISTIPFFIFEFILLFFGKKLSFFFNEVHS